MQKWSKVVQNPVTLQREAGFLFFSGDAGKMGPSIIMNGLLLALGDKMTEIVPIESIVSKIILLRGEKDMIDRDLAELYSVETKQLKRAVRRNLHRFPADFMFELTRD